MNVFTTWVTGEKWNDLNSTMVNKEGHMFIYTFDPSNNLPVINDITKVELIDPKTNKYITQTGFYIFENPDSKTEIENFYNDDGSLDIMYKIPAREESGREIISGTRIFLSGAVTAIDGTRRVIYSEK
jgi:hypothetical protein